MPDPTTYPRTVSQRDVRAYPMLALVGLALTGAVTGDLRAEAGQAQAVKTLTVGGSFSAGQAYTYSLAGYDKTYTSVSGDTNNDGVAASIAAQINQDPNLRGYVAATVASAVITLTSLIPGEDFLLASGTNVTAAVVTAAAGPTAVPFGRLMLSSAAGGADWDPMTRNGKLAAALAAQQDTLLLTYGATTNYNFEIRINGGAPVYITEVADTDAPDTIDNLVATVAADPALIAAGVTVVNEGAGVLSWNAPAGDSFELEWSVDTGAGTLTAYTSNRGWATDFEAAAYGVSQRNADNEVDANGDGTWAAGDNVACVRKGQVWVETDPAETIIPGGAVWASLAAGATQGRLYATPGTNRRRVRKARWIQGTRPSESQLIGLLEVDFTVPTP